MSTTPDQASSMTSALAALRDALTRYAATLATQSSGFSGVGNWLETKFADNTSQEAAQNALTQWQAQVQRLDDDRARVDDGSMSVTNWFGTAAALKQTLESSNVDVGSWSFSGIVAQTTSATVADVKKDAAIGAAIGLPIILAIGGLYLLLILGPAARGRA